MQKIINAIFHFLSRRLVVIGLALLVQLVWFVVLFIVIGQRYSTYVNAFISVLSILIELYIINKNGNNSYKILWLLFIGVLPVLGSITYIFYGDKRPSRRMRRRLYEGKKELGFHETDSYSVSSNTNNVERYLENCGFPGYTNTKITYFPQGEEAFSQLLFDLSNAKHYIFMEYFIISEGNMWNRIKKILAEKAAHGVDVRITYDDVGSIDTLPKKFIKEMKALNIQVFAFNPFRPILSAVMNNRNHRKITVIDGYIAYTGGFNIADEYINERNRFGHWKDTAVRLYGEAAFPFTKMFLELWNSFHITNDNIAIYDPHTYHPEPFHGDALVQPYYNSPFENETMAQDVYIDIISKAEKYLYIFTPYLAIDTEMRHALCLAGKRGVDVRIVTPGIPDKKSVFLLTRSYYEELIRSGVKIYEYTPGFLHAKSYLSDDQIAVVGTINMDYRSLYLHMEDAVLIKNSPMLKTLKLDYIITLDVCRQITLQDTKKGKRHVLWRTILRTLSPLL